MVITPEEIQELEQFFKTASMPKTISFGEGVKIIDTRTFVDSHLAVLKSNPKPVYEAFALRLFQLRDRLGRKNGMDSTKYGS
jgi:hypothetical protein